MKGIFLSLFVHFFIIFIIGVLEYNFDNYLTISKEKDFFNILILEEKTETQVTQPTPSEQRSRIAETQTQDAQLTISGQTSRTTKIVNNVKKPPNLPSKKNDINSKLNEKKMLFENRKNYFVPVNEYSTIVKNKIMSLKPTSSSQNNCKVNKTKKIKPKQKKIYVNSQKITIDNLLGQSLKYKNIIFKQKVNISQLLNYKVKQSQNLYCLN